MDYFRSKRFLESLPDWEAGRPSLGPPEEYLPRMRALLGRLGHPETRCRSIIVGGTNGKGTVSSLLAALLGAAGLRVGLYTSPHLHTWRERIRLAGAVVTKDRWAEGVSVLYDATRGFEAEGHGPFTRFEALTALAAHLFAADGLTFAVYEVGLGGRYDATNAWDSEAAVLTSIGLDHVEVLGHTLAEIAGDKACIARPGRPLFTLAGQPTEALAALLADAERRQVAVHLVGRSGVTGPDGKVRPPVLEPGPLPGRPATYEENSRLALAVAGHLAGDRLTREQARSVVADHQWPGRFETARREPLVLLDGAHNAPAAAALARELQGIRPSWTIVAGGTRGHDAAAVLASLAPLARRLLLTSSDHPRALPPADLVPLVPPGPVVEVMPSCREALDRALAETGPGEGICVTGSLYLVARAREYFNLPAERDGITEDVALESLACLELACQRIDARYEPVSGDGNVIRVTLGGQQRHFLRNKHPFNDYVAGRLAEDKGYQHELFLRAGVPTPETMQVFNPLADTRFDRYRTHPSIEAAVDEAERRLHYPVVVKKHQSSLAQGVFLETDRAGLQRRLQALFENAGFLDNLVLLQEYVTGPEYRIVATREELLLAYAKVSDAPSGAGDLNPLHQADGRAARVKDETLLTRMRTLTERVGQILGLGFYAIDFIDRLIDGRIDGERGFVVLELNPNPFCFFYNRSHGRADFVGIYERLLRRYLQPD